MGLVETTLTDLLIGVRRLAPGGWTDLTPLRPWWRRPRVRGRLAAAALLLLIAASALLLRASHSRREALARRQREEEAARLDSRAAAGERAARLARIHTLMTTTAELAAPRPAHGDFLMALAASIPRRAVLTELAVDGGRIVLCARVCDRAARTGEVAAGWSADLDAQGAPWSVRPAAFPPGGSEFVLSGSFQPQAPVPAPPDPTPAGTAEELARAEARLAEAGAVLPRPSSLEGKLDPLRSKGWTLAAQSSELRSGYEVRHTSLRCAGPPLSEWPDIVASVRGLCDEPGLSIDHIHLAAASDGAPVFVRAELGLTERLKP